MAINFPNDPSTGDPHAENGVSWVYNGNAWVSNPNSGGGGGDVTTDSAWGSKGELIVATGPDAAATLPVVANNLVLVSDDSTTTGLKWDLPPVPDPVDGPSGVWNNKPSEMTVALASDGSGDGVTDLMTLFGTGSASTNNESNNFTATLTQDIFSIKISGIQSGINGEDYIGSSGLIEVRQDATGGHVISPQHPLNIVMSGDPVNMSLITPETGVGTIGWYKYGADAAALYLYFSDVT